MKFPTNKTAAALASISSILAAAPLAGQEGYTSPPIFNPYPAYNGSWNVQNFGPVGIGLDIKEPGFTAVIRNVEEGSPAARTGQLKPGQVIESFNGQVLEKRDPREILGDILTEAEATDGMVRLKIQGAGEVVVSIPVMGRYNASWPLDCPKSDKIVRQLAGILAKDEKPRWGSVLFLLSTGDEKDLEVVRRWMKDFETVGEMNWEKGYKGPGICEYYLRTGDASVLPKIKAMTEELRENMYNGGWSGKGKPAQFTYSTGTGQVHASGMHCVTFLLMARLCGVEVDEPMLQDALKAFFRFAGHGNVPYGDGLPEGGFRDNGKTGGLAVAMAAAALLTPVGESSIYAQARDNSAMKSFYATNWFHDGHTGGGIGEIWHHKAMSLMRDKRPIPYRSYLDTRRWVMDLSRRPDGSIGIAGMTDRYDRSATEDQMAWGTYFALTYTLPRKQLQLFGAPRSKWARHHPLPVRPWGNAADDLFQATAPLDHPSISIEDLMMETVPESASVPVFNRLGDPEVSDEVLTRYLHHPEFGLRVAAIRAAVEHGRHHFIVPLLKAQDPRLRHLGLLGLTGMFKGRAIPDEQLTPEMFDLVGAIIENRDESWWVAQDAVHALARADKPVIAKHRDRLLEMLDHDSVWIRMAAVGALARICTEPAHYMTVLPRIIDTTTAFRNDEASSKGSTAIRNALASAGPEVKAFAAPLVQLSYTSIPDEFFAPGGAVLTDGAKVVRNRMGSIIRQLPEGLQFLAKLPKKTLAHAKSGLDSDLYVYDGFTPNPQLVGRWQELKKAWERHPIDDRMVAVYAEEGRRFIAARNKGHSTGNHGYQQTYLVLNADGTVEGDPTRLWSGDMLVLGSEVEARRMELRTVKGVEYLLVEIGNFPNRAEDDWHCGHVIHVREP